MVTPIAGDDNFIIDFGGPQGAPPFSTTTNRYTLDIGSNDFNLFNDSLTYTIVSEPTLGIVDDRFSINSSTVSVGYNPTFGAAGLDTFVYQISDTDGNTDTATVSITLFSTPVANTDYVIATPGVPITIDVKANDTDADGQTLSLVPFTDTNENLIIGTDDQIIYTPAADATGDTSFSYQITDNFRSSTGTVFVTLAPDIPSNFSTPQTIEVGQSIQSELNGSIIPGFFISRIGFYPERSTDPKIFSRPNLYQEKPTE